MEGVFLHFIGDGEIETNCDSIKDLLSSFTLAFSLLLLDASFNISNRRFSLKTAISSNFDRI